MFSRLITYLFQQLLSYIRGRLVAAHTKVEIKTSESPHGVASVKLWPLSNSSLALIMPNGKLGPQETEEQLNCFMSLNEPDARSPYDLINWLTESDFFLSQTTKRADDYRKILIKFLNPQTFHSQTLQMMGKLTAELADEKNGTDTDKSCVIEQYIANQISQTLYGMKYTTALDTLVEKIETVFKQYGPYLKSLRPLLLSAERSKIDKQIKFILRTTLLSLRKQSQHNESEPQNFITAIIFETYQKKISSLSDQEIESLLSDPSLRLSIPGLIPVKGFSRLVTLAMKELFLSNDGGEFYESLKLEINNYSQNKILDKDAYMMRDKMPMLHAFFLEALSLHTIMPIIGRVTQNGIQTNHLNLSHNSVAFFNIRSALRLNTSEHGFNPKRFLKEDGSLNNAATLHKNYMTPFGVGPRMCPAAKIVELMFKCTVANLILNVENLQNLLFLGLFSFNKIRSS